LNDRGDAILDDHDLQAVMQRCRKDARVTRPALRRDGARRECRQRKQNG
jgi:hypothetical protein